MGAAPTTEQVGNLKTYSTFSLTVSCCLRQPRITSGATRDPSLCLVVRQIHLREGDAHQLKCFVNREMGVTRPHSQAS